MMEAMFDTPLRSAALGVLIVAILTVIRGLILGRSYRLPALILIVLAISMVLVSEGLQ